MVALCLYFDKALVCAGAVEAGPNIEKCGWLGQKMPFKITSVRPWVLQRHPLIKTNINGNLQWSEADAAWTVSSTVEKPTARLANFFSLWRKKISILNIRIRILTFPSGQNQLAVCHQLILYDCFHLHEHLFLIFFSHYSKLSTSRYILQTQSDINLAKHWISKKHHINAVLATYEPLKYTFMWHIW